MKAIIKHTETAVRDNVRHEEIFGIRKTEH